HFSEHIGARGRAAHEAWTERFAEYEAQHPELARQWAQIEDRELPDGWDADLPVFETSEKGTASRNSSGKVINAIANNVPWFLGGSADLAGSTKTLIDGAESFSAQ